jgi:hypothetical protein
MLCGVVKPWRMPMAQTRRKPVSGELRRLAERLAAHRKRTPRRRRIPEAIWDAAVSLAERQGVNPVARTLGLDYYSLKQRLLDRRASACRPGRDGVGGDGPGAVLPEFVEVCVGGPAPGMGWAVAFEDGSGRRLTLRAPEGKDVDVAALAEVFWRRPG